MAVGNDVTILASILGILLVMGIVMPWVYELIGGVGESHTMPSVDETTLQESSFTDLWGTGVFTSIIKSFFWVYAWFPAWLSYLHILMRVVAVFIIVRLVRGTG